MKVTKTQKQVAYLYGSTILGDFDGVLVSI